MSLQCFVIRGEVRDLGRAQFLGGPGHLGVLGTGATLILVYRLDELLLRELDDVRALVVPFAVVAVTVGADLLGAESLGEQATLLQFSTDFCTRCPSVHRDLSRIAAEHPGVSHLDVDLTNRPDLAKQFHVLQTPTTLILDRDGVIQTRFGGVPGRGVVELELKRITRGSRASV